MPATITPDLAPLIGSWRLISTAATLTDNGERVETFGPNPSGRMVFTPGGRIMFLIVRSDRQPATNDTERATLFNGMIAYSGLVRLGEPGQFITAVDVSIVPTEVGKEKVRHFIVDGDSLTIRLPEQMSRFHHGRMSVSELIWERESVRRFRLPAHDAGQVPNSGDTGNWRLESINLFNTKAWVTLSISERVPNPDGCMVNDLLGHRLMVLLTKPGRQPPTNDAERAILFNDLIAFSGLTQSNGADRMNFSMTVDIAANPTLVGTQLPVAIPDIQWGDGLRVGDMLFKRGHPRS